MASPFGVEVRESRASNWVQLRQRGGAVVRYSLVALDLAASDALTSTFADAGSKNNPGKQDTASSPLATVLEATSGMTHGRLGVVMGANVKDDALGLYEFGERGDGTAVPLIVDAYVLVDAASVEGAALQVSSSGGTAVFASGVAGGTYGILLDECTTDDGSGIAATYNVKRVILYSEGLAAAPDVTLADIGTADIEDDAITRAKLADAAGMTHQTRAALFEPGIAGSMQRCSFSFDPTNTTDLTIRFKRRGLSRPAASEIYRLAGFSSSDRPVIAISNTAGVYAIEMRESATALLSYTWTDDLEEHEWTFAYLSTGCTITLDGTVVATGVTAGSFLNTSFTCVIGNSLVSASFFDGDHATYRDFEVIDPATATNKVFLRLDEPSDGGPYYNAHLRVGDPLYDATNTSAIQIATTGTDTARPKSVEVNTVSGNAAPVIAGGRSTHMRVAAFSGLGDHATAGCFGSVAWAPTGTPAFNVEFDLRRSLTQAGTVNLWGRIAASYANIQITNTGVLIANVNSAAICTTPAVAIPNDGRVRRVRVEFRDSGADVTAAIYVSGRLLISGTLAATQFSAVAADHFVGSSSAGARRYSGTISNVLLEDLNSAANSGFYLMDEPRGSTTYANTYPGTSLAGLTINGYVSSCGVESEDGKGRPWQLGDGAPLIYAAYASVDQVGINANADLTTFFDTEVLDPTASLASGTFTAPCAGIVIPSVQLSLTETAAAADTLALGFKLSGTLGQRYVRVNVEASVVNKLLTYTAHPVAVTAGQTLYVSLSDFATATVNAEDHSSIQFLFSPTPVAG